MHSRKARINDGYYENQSRSFQNSKYNSNSNRYSNYYNNNRDRDASPKRNISVSIPVPNKRIAHRSPSAEGSPRDSRDSRDRHYQGSNSYRNKDRDRDYKKEKYSDKRGRDRELEYKSYSKKAKPRDRSSSEEDHKESERLYEKSKYTDRDALRRTTEKERKYGEWKEMISKNNGKKYYYNERDKSSQWEKPEEWVEYEMSKDYSSSRGYRDKERDSSRGKGREDRYNRNRNYKDSADDRYNSKHSRGNSRWPPHESYQAASTSSGHKGRHEDNADMDISPESTPTSEPSYSSPTIGNNHPNNSNNNNNLNHDEIMTSPNGHAKHPLNITNSSSSLHHQMSNASSTSILSSSSKLNSAAAAAATNSNNKNSTTTSSSSPSTHNYSSYSSHHLHNRHRSTSPNDINLLNNVAGGGSKGGGENDAAANNSLHHSSSSLRNSPTNPINSSVSRLELNNSSSNSNHLGGDGPPTPEMDLNSGSEHRRLDTASGVSSLQSVMSASQSSNRLNLLTPSLAKYFRPDLITHVTNWPAEILEKQAQKCAEEVYLLGDLECSKISAEIQCARSIVRVAEIAATIQTQRRLFLQEQIKSLDESQTQNSSTISY